MWINIVICEGFRLPFPIYHKRNGKKNVLHNGTKGRRPRFFRFPLTRSSLSHAHSLSLPFWIPIALTCKYNTTTVTLGRCQTLNTVLFWRCVLRVFQSIAYHRLLCGAQGRLFYLFFSIVFFLIVCCYCSSFNFDFCFSDKIVRNNISYWLV